MPDIDWKAEYHKLCETMQDDLRPLLRELGLFDGARPQSPQEVLRQATRRARELRRRLDELSAILADPNL